MNLSRNLARATCLLVSLPLALAACTSDGPKTNENAVPSDADFRKEVIDLLIKSLDDPTNIRDAGISQPVLRPVDGLNRYAACVRFNVRNMNHDYTGLTERIAYFYGGHVNQFLNATPGQCSFASYRPFPELEIVCQGVRCD